MHQYRTVTKDDVTISFEQSTKTKNNGKVLKYSTNQDLAKPVSKVDKSTQTHPPATPTTPHAEPGPSTPSTSNHSSPATTPLAVTPSKRRISSIGSGDRNKCRKCQIAYESKMDNDLNSLWINCEQRNCKYWVHLACLGIVVDEEKEDIFTENFQYFCINHNPKKNVKTRAILK